MRGVRTVIKRDVAAAARIVGPGPGGEWLELAFPPSLPRYLYLCLSTFSKLKSAQIANGAREHFIFPPLHWYQSAQKFAAAAAEPPGWMH